MFGDRYIDYAENIITAYDGKEPFHLFLKKYFQQNRKHGSKDRRHITRLCYNYFRLGNGVTTSLSVKERIGLGVRIFDDKETVPKEQSRIPDPPFDPDNIFPFPNLLSPQIPIKDFSRSFLKQPDLFIRIRPGYEDELFMKLTASNIPYVAISKDCISLPNTTIADQLFKIDQQAVIQDRSSQETIRLLEDIQFLNKPVSVWDVCAGSGGKSILLSDKLSDIRLTVSDKRTSILSNLKKRFRNAGIGYYRCFQADLTHPLSQTSPMEKFDLIVADVPCTGSGTWARTPAQLQYFDIRTLPEMAALQRKIVASTLPQLKSNGYFLYLTCSVFAAENEENIRVLKQQFPLKIVRQEYLKGYNHRADTLFGYLLQLH